MTAPTSRRALPALICILVLCALTAIVWWRVLNRDGTSSASPRSTSPTPTRTACPSAPVVTPTVLPKPSAVRLILLNSTTRNRLAATTKPSFTKLGFKVVKIDNDALKYGGSGAAVAGVAQIRYAAADAAAARLVSFYLPGATLRQLAGTSDVTVSLGNKYKALATPAAAAAAMKAAGASVAPKGSPSPTPTTSPSKSC